MTKVESYNIKNSQDAGYMSNITDISFPDIFASMNTGRESSDRVLKTVIEGINGLKVREEVLDRAYASGKINFLERWSQKKELKRRLKEKIKNAHSRRKI